MDDYINVEIIQDGSQFGVRVNAYVGGLTFEEAEDTANIVEEDLREDMLGESS